MLSIENITEPKFLVLPSIFIHNIYVYAKGEFYILEPIMGKYTVRTLEMMPTADAPVIIKIKNKMYLITRPDFQLSELKIFVISNNEIKHVKTIKIGNFYPAITHKQIKWPIYSNTPVNDSKETLCMIDENLELKFRITNNTQTSKITIDANAVKTSPINLISCIGNNSCLYSKNNMIYMSEYKLRDHCDIVEYTYSRQFFDLNTLHEPINFGICRKVNEYFTLINGKYIVNIYGEKGYLTDIRQVDSIISNKTWILDQDCQKLLFIMDDINNFDVNNTNMSINDMGFIHSVINYPEGNYINNRISEDPFKSEERDRLTEWLYNQLEKILPIAITGIITNYCCLVEYYEYDILTKYFDTLA